MSDHKPIHFHVYDPSTSFFKSSKNDAAKRFVVLCNNSENCELHKKGTCILRSFWGGGCPYGYCSNEEGYTRRARGFGTWIRKQGEMYKGVPSISSPPKKLAVVGDYIYIPYAHANMNKEVPFLGHGGFMSSGSNFIKKEDWTIHNIAKIVAFHPQALMGGYIDSYWKEEVPLFLSHLEEVMPDMYKELLATYPQFIKSFNLLAPKNYVGRKAKVKTLSPCTFRTKGSQDGDYKVTWIWDGKVLKTASDSVYQSIWGSVNKYESLEMTLIPNDDSVIEITDNAQVNAGTVFVD